MIQDLPRCFGCSEVVEHSPVFAAPLCEHEQCASAVWHGLCLMEWREKRDALVKALRERLGNTDGHGSMGHFLREEG